MSERQNIHERRNASELRRRLQSARADYRGATYPGDLAAEMLPPRRSRIGFRWFAPLLAGGVAAAVTAMVLPPKSVPQSPTAPHQFQPLAIAAPPESPLAAQRPASHVLPDHLPLAIPVSPLIPSPVVSVSLSSVNEGLDSLQQGSYGDFGKLIESFQRRNQPPRQQPRLDEGSRGLDVVENATE